MTNNQLCNFLGILGCIVASFSMGFMFFGIPSAVWGAIIGVVLGGLALVNYD